MATSLDEADQFLSNADQLIGQPTGNNEVDQFIGGADKFLGEVPDIDQQERATRPDVSKTESFLRGVSQGATFNFGDEASAAFEATLGSVESILKGKNAFRNEGTFSGISNFISNYEKSLEELRGQNEKSRLANPGSFIAGEVGGALVTSPGIQARVARLFKGAVALSRGAKAATDLARVSNAVAKTGALGSEAVIKGAGITQRIILGTARAGKLGAIEGAGITQKIIQGTARAGKLGAIEGAVAGAGAGEDFSERVKLGAIGGVVGGVAGKGFEKGGELFQKAAGSEFVSAVRKSIADRVDNVVDSLADTAGKYSLRSIKASGAGIREMRRLNRMDKIGQLGRDLLNPQELPLGGKVTKKAIGFKSLSKTKEIIDENLDLVNSQADEFVSVFDDAFDESIRLGAPAKEAEDFFKIDANEFIKEMKSGISKKFNASADKPIKRELQNSIDDFASDWAGKKLSLKEAIAEKQGFQRRVNFFKSQSGTSPGQGIGPVEQGFNDFQKKMNGFIDKKADQIINKIHPDKSGTFKRIRELQGNFIDAARITQDALDRKAANNVFSLTDIIIGTAGVAGGAAAAGPTGAVKGLAIAGAIKGGNYAAPRVLANLANVGSKAAGSKATKLTADVIARGTATAANKIANGLKKNFNRMGVFKDALQEAGKRGTPSLLATHLILFKTNEDYRKQIEDLDEVE